MKHLRRLGVLFILLVWLSITSPTTWAATTWQAPNDSACLFNGGDMVCFPPSPERWDLRKIPQSTTNNTPSGWGDAAVGVATGDVCMRLFNDNGKFITEIEPNQNLQDLPPSAMNKVRYIEVSYSS
jgi:hypothetical protein